MAKSYKKIVDEYVDKVIAGKLIVGKEVILACIRYRNDLKREEFDFDTKDPDFVIGIIERTMVHQKGEALDGTPLKNKPLILSPWQCFIIYNLLGFKIKGTKIRRFKEAFIFIPRKNGKTTFIAGLAWALALLERKSGASIYIVAASQKQACESFDFIKYSMRFQGMKEDEGYRILDNNAEHSISYEFVNDDDIVEGSMHIEALASNPDAQDSFNCNIAIADEVHAFKKAAQYNRFKEAMKAYSNKLMIGITTAGDDINSFCYQKLQYCEKIVNGTVKDDSYFVFISKADEDEKGNVDYLAPVQHQKANPGYGVTIRPEDMEDDARQAQNDPQQRKDFLSRSLNIYTSSVKSYFDLKTFRASDRQYSWTLEELAKLPIEWFGGADLSRRHDLTAGCITGTYQGVDIYITHAWFPVVAAAQKAEEDNIPLYDWLDNGWLDMCNDAVVNLSEIVNWFIHLREKGFKIQQVGYDRKFSSEFFVEMKKHKFDIVDQPQYYSLKSAGFRHIEASAIDGKIYYMHSGMFEYCTENVRAIEKTDDMIQYDKVNTPMRIDVFDCSVFATIRKDLYTSEKEERRDKAKKWYGEK